MSLPQGCIEAFPVAELQKEVFLMRGYPIELFALYTNWASNVDGLSVLYFMTSCGG